MLNKGLTTSSVTLPLDREKEVFTKSAYPFCMGLSTAVSCCGAKVVTSASRKRRMLPLLY